MRAAFLSASPDDINQRKGKASARETEVWSHRCANSLWLFFFFPLKKNKTKRQSRNVFEHSEIFNIRTEFRWKREHRGCGRQKHSSRPPTRDTPLNLQMGASVYRALVCCPSAPKNQGGMSDGDGNGGWWMGMQRERNSRFVFVPFTQKPRRVIARSTPRRWKVGWEYRGGGSHSLL